jgi:hypothetical protein
LIVAQVPVGSNPTQYESGSLRNITFNGPGIGSGPTSSIGIMIGGDSTGVFTPNTYQAFLFNLYDVHSRNFGCGINYGNAYQIAQFGGSYESNWNGICFLYGLGGENINFHGTQMTCPLKTLRIGAGVLS